MIKRESMLTASSVDRKYRNAIKGMRKSEAEASFYLADMERRRLWKKLGYSSTIHYAMVAGCISEGKAWQLLKLGRDLERYPRLRQAFAEGEVGWTKLREVLRLKEKGDDSGLLDLALSRTNRELEQYVTERNRKYREGVLNIRVSTSKKLNGSEKSVLTAQTKISGREAKKPESAAATEEQWNLGSVEPGKAPAPANDGLITVTLRCTPEQHAIFTSACTKQRKSVPGKPSREETVSEIMLDFLDDRSHRAPEINTCGISGEVQLVDSPYVMVLHQCPECGKNSVFSESGKEVEVSKTAMEQASCDCSYYEASEEGMPGRKKRVVSPAVRRKVLLRDHGRCRTPGCSHTRFLQVHHIRPVSAGGSNDPANLLTLCSLCHSHVHKGRLRIIGESPSVEFFHKDNRGMDIPFGKSVFRM